jgi:hypothetical protein
MPARSGRRRIALLDVNVLVALFDPNHIHHDLAHDWFAEHGSSAWATCPITEAGFVRVVTNPKYGPDPLRPAAALELLRRFCQRDGHSFWEDRVSLRDTSLFALDVAGGHRQLTDVYLLGLARTMDGTLATFDRTIPRAAVKGAGQAHLSIIEPV